MQHAKRRTRGDQNMRRGREGGGGRGISGTRTSERHFSLLLFPFMVSARSYFLEILKSFTAGPFKIFPKCYSLFSAKAEENRSLNPF